MAVALAQIGEFSFILSTIGRDLAFNTEAATNTTSPPPCCRSSSTPLIRWRCARRAMDALSPDGAVDELRARHLIQRTGWRRGIPPHRVVVIGYGPTGRTVVRPPYNRSNRPSSSIWTALQRDGIHAVYGERRPDGLTAGNVASAGSRILRSGGMALSTGVIRAARQLNPKLRVLARGAYLRDLPPLKQAGADTAYSGEGEVALAFIEDILETLGATPEQIERGRARAHGQLFGLQEQAAEERSLNARRET